MPRRSFQPFRRLDAAAFDDRPHGAERKHAATVMGNDYLFSGERMTPLLVATGSADPHKLGDGRRTPITWSEESLGVRIHPTVTSKSFASSGKSMSPGIR